MKHGIVTFEQPSRKFEKVYAANFGYVLIDGYRFFLIFFFTSDQITYCLMFTVNYYLGAKFIFWYVVFR